MKYYNIFLIILSLFIVMSFASATISDLSPVKINTCINLPQIEFGSTYQNLTFILFPDKTRQVIGQYMNGSANGYYYNFCDTLQIGTYTANGCSDISCWNYNFVVTPTGFTNTIGFYIVIIVLIIAIVILGVSLSELWFVVIAGMMLILFGIYTINFGIADQKDMFMTWVIGLFEIGIGTILSLGAAYQKMEIE